MKKIIIEVLFWVCVLGPIVWLFFATSCTRRTPLEKARIKHNELVKQFPALHDSVHTRDSIRLIDSFYVTNTNTITITEIDTIIKDCPEDKKPGIRKRLKDRSSLKSQLPDVYPFKIPEGNFSFWIQDEKPAFAFDRYKVTEKTVVHSPCPDWTYWDHLQVVWLVIGFLLLGWVFFIWLVINIVKTYKK